MQERAIEDFITRRVIPTEAKRTAQSLGRLRMRLATVLVILFLSVCFGCPRDNPKDRGNRESARQAELKSLVPEAATNIEANYISDPHGTELTLLSCDWATTGQPSEVEAQIKDRFQRAGWVSLEHDLVFLDRRAEWAELPPDREGQVGDESLTVWWLDQESNAIELSLFHWRTRTDGGPKYRIVLRFFPNKSIKKNLNSYSQRFELPNR